MTTYNTQNPLGSSDPRDLYDNAENLDAAVNSDSDHFTDRLGKLRPTLKGAIDPTGLASSAAASAQQAVGAAAIAVGAADRAEFAQEAAAATGGIYPDITTGFNDTPEGDYFWAVSADDGEVLELWLAGASQAEDTGKKTLSKGGAIEELSQILFSEVRLNQLIERQPVFSKASFVSDFSKGIFASTNFKAAISSRSMSDVINCERSSLAWCWGADGFLKQVNENEFCFDHDPKTGESRGIFRGEQRTNTVKFSDDLTNAAWNIATTTTATAEANAGIHTDGTETSCAIVEGSDLNYHTRRCYAEIEIGKKHTVSFIAKRGNGNRNINWYSKSLTQYFGLSDSTQGVMFDLENGIVKETWSELTGDIFDIGKGRFWCVVYLPEAILTGDEFDYTLALCLESAINPTFPTYQGDGASSVIVSCCQLEAVSTSNQLPSLPIRTSGANYTREADTVRADASWATNKDGTLYFEFAGFTQSDTLTYPSIAVIEDNIGTERFGFYAFSSTRSVLAQVVPPNASQVAIGSPALLEFNKLAARFKSDDKAISLNGVVTSWSSTDAIPDVFNLSLGKRVGSSSEFTGWFRSVAWINNSIENTELSLLTSEVIAPVEPVEPVEPITNVVELMYSNLGSDSRELEVVWWSDSDTDKTLMYRVRDSGEYFAVQSETVELMPSTAGTYIHRAIIKNLSPDCEYDVHVKNSVYYDIFYTPPIADLKVALAADWQYYNFSSTGRYALFGQQAQANDAHFYIQGGDYVNDDGLSTSSQINNWRSMMSVITKYWRRGDALMPGVYVMGNHEGSNAAGTSNAYSDGDGTHGPISSLMSAGYYEGSRVTGDFRSTGCVTIGKELAIIFLETDHTVPLIDQLPWFESKLAEVYPKVRHIMVVGHASPFIINHLYNWETETQTGVLRNFFWPAMQPYADKIAFYFCGHEHSSSDSGPKQIDYDPELTYEQNKTRWRTVTDSQGVRSLMIGPAGASNTTYPVDSRMLAESSLDSSTWVVMGFGHDNTSNTTNTYGAVTNMRPNHHCIGIADFHAGGWSVRYIGEDGVQFYEVEPI